MYVPASFRVEDAAELYAFIRRYPFAALMTAPGGVPFATHVPLLLDAERGVLRGHLARANPQVRHLEGGAEALVIFHGPHAYISPSWYAPGPAVPTWNYAAVHVYGTPRVLSGSETSRLLDELVAEYESPRQEPWSGDLPAEFRQRMEAEIVGFEVPLGRVEGKYKLSQNRPAQDRLRVAQALEAGGRPGDRDVAELMRRWAIPPGNAGG